VQTAAQNNQIRAAHLEIVNQPTAAPNGGYTRGLPSASRLRYVITVSADGQARRHGERPRSRARPGARSPCVRSRRASTAVTWWSPTHLIATADADVLVLGGHA
jgi:hypothetical protein